MVQAAITGTARSVVSGLSFVTCNQANGCGCPVQIGPAYCDVIVRVWEAFTGKKAERVNAAGL